MEFGDGRRQRIGAVGGPGAAGYEQHRRGQECGGYGVRQATPSPQAALLVSEMTSKRGQKIDHRKVACQPRKSANQRTAGGPWSAPRFACSPWGRKMQREAPWANPAETDGRRVFSLGLSGSSRPRGAYEDSQRQGQQSTQGV